jgi:hypothetical protein
LEDFKISYENERHIFLDIDCFFKANWEDDIKVLDSYDYSSVDGIHVLVERFLIIISEHNILEMHNLLGTWVVKLLG